MFQSYSKVHLFLHCFFYTVLLRFIWFIITSNSLWWLEILPKCWGLSASVTFYIHVTCCFKCDISVYSVVNKGQVQKRRREKFPVDIPEEKSVPSKEKTVTMDIESSKNENTGGKSSSPPVEKPVVVPLQPAQTTEPNPVVPRESKSVRICEDPPVCIPDAPRSVPTSACQPYTFLLRCVNSAVFVIFLLLGFMRALAPRPALPALPLRNPLAQRNIFDI